MSSPRKRAQPATRYSTRSQSPQKVDTTAAKKSMPKRQPSVHSEQFESEHTTDAGDQYPKPRKSAREAHAEKILIDQKLGKYHVYLREEDQDQQPDFKDLYHEIRAFITNLASSKAMFDSRLYNDVKSMIRAYSEKWAQDEQKEAPTTKRKSSNTSSGRSTATSTSAASRVFSPGLAHDNDNGLESPQTTITTPTDSPIKRKTVAFEEEEQEIDGGYLYPEYDYDEDDDGDLLEFAPGLLAAAEKRAAALAQKEEEEDELSTPPPPPKPTRTTTRLTASKRRISDAVDLDTPDKRRKRGQHVPASTISRAAELSTVNKKGTTTTTTTTTATVKPGGKQRGGARKGE
ncbi:MAG: hypothetical protein Q9212_006994, partial [Teloschistes hypoglaucus]